MPPVTCQRCNQPITSFAQWFTQDCPMEQPALRDYGHKLSCLDIMALEFRPVSQLEQQEG